MPPTSKEGSSIDSRFFLKKDVTDVMSAVKEPDWVIAEIQTAIHTRSQE